MTLGLLALDAPVPLVLEQLVAEEAGRREDALVSAADVAAWRRWAAGAKEKRKKRRKRKLPKASFGRRSCDHAAQVHAVLAARELDGASDSLHRQTLEFPVAPQRDRFAQCQTVQVTGFPQFLGEVADAPVVVQRLVPGMVQTVQTSGGVRRSCEHAAKSSSSSQDVSRV